MKKLVLIAFFFIGISVSQAQELKWYTNIKEAITVSNKEKKPLMLFFTGSDWCGWCMHLQAEVFKTPEFDKWAKERVILVELDFPRRTPQADELKMQNNELQQFFGVQGYPTVYFTNATVDKKGKVSFSPLGSTGYVAGGPTAWIASTEAFVKKPVVSKSKSKK